MRQRENPPVRMRVETRCRNRALRNLNPSDQIIEPKARVGSGCPNPFHNPRGGLNYATAEMGHASPGGDWADNSSDATVGNRVGDAVPISVLNGEDQYDGDNGEDHPFTSVNEGAPESAIFTAPYGFASQRSRFYDSALAADLVANPRE